MDQAIGLSSVVYRQKNVNRLKRVKVTGVVRYVTAFQLVGGHIQGSKSTLGYKSWKTNKFHRYFHAIWRTLGLTCQLTSWLANVGWHETRSSILPEWQAQKGEGNGRKAPKGGKREGSLSPSLHNTPPFFFPSSQSPNPALSTPATRARSSIAFFFSFQALRW